MTVSKQNLFQEAARNDYLWFNRYFLLQKRERKFSCLHGKWCSSPLQISNRVELTLSLLFC